MFFSKAILRASCDVWARIQRVKRPRTPCVDELRMSPRPERLGTKVPSRRRLLARQLDLAIPDFDGKDVNKPHHGLRQVGD